VSSGCSTGVAHGGQTWGHPAAWARAGFGQGQPDPVQGWAGRTHTTCNAFGALTNIFSSLIYARK